MTSADPTAAAPTSPAARGPLPNAAPAAIAGWLGCAVGVGFVLLGLRLLLGGSDLPGALQVALLLIGGLQLVCGVQARRRVRAAWAFALSLNATLFVVLLFGAPKVRDAAEIGLGAALAPAIVFAIITTLYALSSDEY